MQTNTDGLIYSISALLPSITLQLYGHCSYYVILAIELIAIHNSNEGRCFGAILNDSPRSYSISSPKSFYPTNSCILSLLRPKTVALGNIN